MKPPRFTQSHALFLDFDGTLAPISADPDEVFLSEHADALLRRASDYLSGAVAIISGRDLRDLAKRAPTSLFRIGGHGLETAAPGEAPDPSPPPAPRDLDVKLAEIADSIDGVRLERKGPIFALHFRAAPEAESVLRAKLDCLTPIFHDYRLQSGKMIFELKPAQANKGTALANAMAGPPFAGRAPIMVGDDTTDEDGFKAAAESGGFGVKVGDGPSIAAHRLADVDGTIRWVEESLP